MASIRGRLEHPDVPVKNYGGSSKAPDALLNAATEDQGNTDGKDALKHHCICARVEAILRPPLWSTIDWVHLQRTHAGANEQNGHHRREEHRADGPLERARQLRRVHAGERLEGLGKLDAG